MKSPTLRYGNSFLHSDETGDILLSLFVANEVSVIKERRKIRAVVEKNLIDIINKGFSLKTKNKIETKL